MQDAHYNLVRAGMRLSSLNNHFLNVTIHEL